MRPTDVRRVVVAFTVFAAAACSNNGGSCSGEVDTAAQIGNTFHVAGNFQNGQPVLTLTMNGTSTVIAASTNTVDQAEFDITGLAKGVYSASWEMSCYNESGTKPIGTNHVPTMTIQ